MNPMILSINEAADALPSSEELIPGISICVPVYRSRNTLVPLVEEIARVMPSICDCFEVLLVEDGCPDNSWEIIEQLSARYPWVRGIRMLRNYGQHNALLCAIRAARCETIVTMDDDLQHPPGEIPKLIAKLNEGHDVVYGTPQEMSHSWWRNVTSRLTKSAFALATGNKNIKTSMRFAQSGRNCGWPLPIFALLNCKSTCYFRGALASLLQPRCVMNRAKSAPRITRSRNSLTTRCCC